MTPDDLRGIYFALTAQPGEWLSLVEMRAAIIGVPKDEVDAALGELLNDERVRIEPEPFGHRVGPDERRAAVHIGGEDRHLIAIWEAA